MHCHRNSIEAIVRVAKKRPCPPVPALSHVMRNMRKDDASEASHGTKLTGGDAGVN